MAMQLTGSSRSRVFSATILGAREGKVGKNRATIGLLLSVSGFRF